MDFLEKSVRPTSVDSWRRIEDYFTDARKLRAAGLSDFHHGLYKSVVPMQAYSNLRMFENLMDSIQSHDESKDPRHRRSLFSLNQSVPLIRNTIGECRSLSESAILVDSEESVRQLRIPQELIDHFVANSLNSTEENIETLGILGGVPVGTKLVVTGLIFPKQRGSSDSCECLDDEKLYNTLEGRKWNVLGWIHTHPQHDLFLSGVDVHTHANYQYFLPEAVAAVYSPIEETQLKIFNLSSEGLENIRQCKKPGFHPDHNGDFQEATHVTVEPGLQFEVIDQRNQE